ncbi:hypothetical protein B0H16DRAFT_1624726 [Mycena metata]|uniref:Uncharacterized protein n=1 Tax=Mycena metata TaxID=1033252 RepID=A0AAD7H4Y9_9AGAR|nr:hypothetical protein B0H16DRAFT_1624726 [Mycena metata]
MGTTLTSTSLLHPHPPARSSTTRTSGVTGVWLYQHFMAAFRLILRVAPSLYRAMRWFKFFSTFTGSLALSSTSYRSLPSPPAAPCHPRLPLLPRQPRRVLHLGLRPAGDLLVHQQRTPLARPREAPAKGCPRPIRICRSVMMAGVLLRRPKVAQRVLVQNPIPTGLRFLPSAEL